MPPVPIVSGREAVRAFERAGWRFVRQKGSHMVLEKPEVRNRLSIPNHREVKVGTLLGEIRKAGLTVAEFIELLN